ncbi:Hypothetical predicted protein, partial [Paramuricea clavata]
DTIQKYLRRQKIERRAVTLTNHLFKSLRATNGYHSIISRGVSIHGSLKGVLYYSLHQAKLDGSLKGVLYYSLHQAKLEFITHKPGHIYRPVKTRYIPGETGAGSSAFWPNAQCLVSVEFHNLNHEDYDRRFPN